MKTFKHFSLQLRRSIMVDTQISQNTVNSLLNGQIKDDKNQENKLEKINEKPDQEITFETNLALKTEIVLKKPEQIPKEALLSPKTETPVEDDKPKIALKNLLRKSSLSGLVSTLRKKNGSGLFGKKVEPAQNLLLTDSDLRKHIFNQKRDRETMKGLRVMDLTKTAFVSNFLLGVILGTVLALLLKLLYELSVKIVLG